MSDHTSPATPVEAIGVLTLFLIMLGSSTVLAQTAIQFLTLVGVEGVIGLAIVWSYEHWLR